MSDEQNGSRIKEIKHVNTPIDLTIENGGVEFGIVLIPTGEDVKVEQRGDTLFVTKDPTAPGVGVTIRLE